jgi:hypothetical protein
MAIETIQPVDRVEMMLGAIEGGENGRDNRATAELIIGRVRKAFDPYVGTYIEKLKPLIHAVIDSYIEESRVDEERQVLDDKLLAVTTPLSNEQMAVLLVELNQRKS